MPPKKILIIEDDTDIAAVYNEPLTQSGYSVQIAHDGKSGLDFLQRGDFDLLLLDIILPDINGLEVLRQWRVTSPDATTKVLVLTNMGEDDLIKQAFDLGAQGYLVKSSLTPDQVVLEVKNALKVS